jgi:hypothetical protein
MRYAFHIGLHKTGSSAVQEYFQNFSDFNLSHGLIYPTSLSGTPSHGEFPWALLGERARWRTGDFDLAEVWDHHITQTNILKEDHGASTTLFSSEDFSLLPPYPEMMKQFYETVKKQDVWIIISLRKPLDYIISWYRHAIRTGQITAAPEELGSIAPWNSLRFSKRLAYWSDLFGKDRIIVNLYNGNSVQAYTDIMGVPLSPDYKNKRVNIPPHPWAIDAYRMLPEGKKFDRARRRLLKLSAYGPKLDPVKSMGLKQGVKKKARQFDAELQECLEMYPLRTLPGET